EANEGIDYVSYDPPSFWGAPYSVLLAKFSAHSSDRGFMSHAGEELLWPVEGAIQYHFAWTPGSRPPDITTLDEPLTPGTGIRLQSQGPHHTWAAGPGDALAWMVFRPEGESPSAISVDPRRGRGRVDLVNRPQQFEEVSEPARFALVAWSIAEQI